MPRYLGLCGCDLMVSGRSSLVLCFRGFMIFGILDFGVFLSRAFKTSGTEAFDAI